MNPNEYLTKFFEEKELEDQDFEIEGPSGTNFISTSVVIEHILITTGSEAENIANIIRKIDFMNGDVNHFLKHMAQALVI